MTELALKLQGRPVGSQGVVGLPAVLLRHAEDPQPLIAEGLWEGRVLEAPRGEQQRSRRRLIELLGIVDVSGPALTLHPAVAALVGPLAQRLLSG